MALFFIQDLFQRIYLWKIFHTNTPLYFSVPNVVKISAQRNNQCINVLATYLKDVPKLAHSDPTLAYFVHRFHLQNSINKFAVAS